MPRPEGSLPRCRPARARALHTEPFWCMPRPATTSCSDAVCASSSSGQRQRAVGRTAKHPPAAAISSSLSFGSGSAAPLTSWRHSVARTGRPQSAFSGVLTGNTSRTRSGSGGGHGRTAAFLQKGHALLRQVSAAQSWLRRTHSTPSPCAAGATMTSPLAGAVARRVAVAVAAPLLHGGPAPASMSPARVAIRQHVEAVETCSCVIGGDQSAQAALIAAESPACRSAPLFTSVKQGKPAQGEHCRRAAHVSTLTSRTLCACFCQRASSVRAARGLCECRWNVVKLSKAATLCIHVAAV